MRDRNKKAWYKPSHKSKNPNLIVDVWKISHPIPNVQAPSIITLENRKHTSYCCSWSSPGHTHVLTHSEPDGSNFNLMVFFTMWQLHSTHSVYNSHLHPRDGWENLIEAMCGLEECSSLCWWWKKRAKEGGTVKCFFDKLKRRGKKD